MTDQQLGAVLAAVRLGEAPQFRRLASRRSVDVLVAGVPVCAVVEQDHYAGWAVEAYDGRRLPLMFPREWSAKGALVQAVASAFDGLVPDAWALAARWRDEFSRWQVDNDP